MEQLLDYITPDTMIRMLCDCNEVNAPIWIVAPIIDALITNQGVTQAIELMSAVDLPARWWPEPVAA